MLNAGGLSGLCQDVYNELVHGSAKKKANKEEKICIEKSNCGKCELLNLGERHTKCSLYPSFKISVGLSKNSVNPNFQNKN